MSSEVPESDGEQVDPVVAATDRRIRERGLKEFGDIVTLMGLDPDYAPDPLDLFEAGISAEGEEGDFKLPDDLED